MIEDKDFSKEADEWFENHLKMMKKPKKSKQKSKDTRPSEYEEQKLCVKYLKKRNILHWSTPNEAERNITTLKRLEMTGLLSGVADLSIMLKDKMIFVEMKRQHKRLKNGLKSKSLNGLKPHQENFQKKVNRFDYCEGYVCNGFEEFEPLMNELIEKYN